MTSNYDNFVGYVDMFNRASKSNDISRAVECGKKILQIGTKELQDPNTSDIQKNYYRTTCNKIEKFIRDVRDGKYEKPESPKEVSRTMKNEFEEKDWFSADVPNLRLKDIAGLKDVKEQFIVNVFAPLNPAFAPIYKKYRKDVGLQVLLYGPPGTGKTHIVKCLAGELGCKIAVVQIKDALAGIVGDGAKIISAVFEQAKKYDRCIIFIDEIDAIAASRDDDESRYTKEQLTTLLTNMDGFTAATRPDQIRIIIAATNRPWCLDTALKRGGRFDTQIYIPLPDYDARLQLVKLALGKDPNMKDRLDIPCADNVTPEYLADRLDGYAGADIKAICKQISSLPLIREIRYFSEYKKEKPDHITRADCDKVLSDYINSITDESLFMFDAYKANLSIAEYLNHIKSSYDPEKINDPKTPNHVKRYYEELKKEEEQKAKEEENRK